MGRWRTVVLLVMTVVVASAVGWPRPAAAEIPADCAREPARPSPDAIPWWSRLQWSVGVGTASRRAQGRWETTAAIAPQVGVALWAREWTCNEYGKGGGLFMAPTRWRRWSLSVTGDLVWRPAERDVIDYRPALRLSRARMSGGDFLSVGSTWVPSTELWVSAGPTLGASSRGASLGLGARFTIFFVEVRGGVHRDAGRSVLVQVGVTDLHGLLDLGPDRTDG